MIILIIVVAVSQGGKSGSNSVGTSNTPATTGGSSATNTPVNAAVPVNTAGLAPAPIATTTSMSPAQVESLKTAKVVVTGANPIAADNKVLTTQGLPTNSAARSVDDSAPKQTGFLTKTELPKTLTQINIAGNQFTPSQITTTVNAPTSFSLTSADNSVHVLNFDDPSLAAIVILVGPGQTKAITFNAPAKAGSYNFFDSTPNSTAKGTLIVK